MIPRGPRRTLFGYSLVFVLALLAAGCGGGSGGSSGAAGAAADFIDLVARPGPIVAVRVGEVAVLDGSLSRSSSPEPLAYVWSFTGKPDASNAELQDATAANPSFVADARGTYTVQLVVSVGSVSSRRVIAFVEATNEGERPTGPFHHAGLSSNCGNCHDGEFPPIVGKSPDHVATSNTCQSCHSTFGFAVIPFVDHVEVFGECSECHNGILAIGKSEFHLPTLAQCDDCHNTDHFIELEPDGSFDHSDIVRACAGCHNGTVSIGKTPTPPHPDTSTDCGFCHTTTSFQGAYPDHSGPEVVGNRCDSCHGVSASGPTVGHPVPSVDCETCHSTVTFSLGGVFNHRLVDPTVQACESCHNDNNSISAPGKGSAVPNHLATVADCGNCHSTDTFAPAFAVDHTDPAVLAARCDSCHGVNASAKSINHLPTTEDCAVCHTPGTFTTGTYDHAGVVNGCALCHNNVISVGKLINHIPTNPDTQDCSDCHNTTDFTVTTFNHTGIDSNNCALCHNGDISIGKSLNHVPTTLDCSACHDIFNFTSFAGITFSHVGIDSNDCASCHATGIATPKIVNHIPAQGDCSVCHDSTAVFASTTFLTTVHQEITRGCEGCHVSRFFPANPNVVKGANHLPTDQDCDVCHTTAAFSPQIFDHAGISGNCVSCHDGNYAGTGALGKTADHIATTQDCGVCHGTAS